MKIAVTGSNGRVGTCVTRRALKDGHTIHGIDRNPASNEGEEGVTFVQCDLRDYEATVNALKGCEGVVHLAAHPTPGDYLATTHNDNVVMSWNILCAAAELGITRIVQASSVNVIPLAWTDMHHFEYFPIDEDHPCLPDEPYGLSKLMAEMQADTIARRHPGTRIGSLRFSWCLPERTRAAQREEAKGAKDLWAWTHEDALARAVLLALGDTARWNGHERFFIVAPQIAQLDGDAKVLHQKYWPTVKVRDDWTLSGRKGFFDCAKAERILGWVHGDDD
ncbi:NAD(P)-binding protein [Auriscalpium vulgare]|uniref:NAD(P)-binding protein n=1 Tax=Auriscalpium vulgare TaxID=40419 RepID=A0ACB8S7D9_9AGAM|nr:NAD(P)-binding protein [Auriscalpium vulgare]